MKRGLMLLTVVLGVLVSQSSVSQTSRQLPGTKKLFITSFFNCDVYWGKRRIAILKSGTRARVLGSTERWILVRFYGDNKYIVGWIRR